MIHLPDAVNDFFQTVNEGDDEAFIKLFTPDAVVLDEGQEMKGTDELIKWSKHAIFYPHVSFKVVSAQERGGRITVTAEVDGDFDKTGLPSPLLLDHHFQLEAGKIKELICAATSGEEN